MDYGAFKTRVGQYLHRSDLTSLIPDFIELGRIRATERLRVPAMEGRAAVALTAGEGSLDVDLVGIIAVKTGDIPLLKVSPSQLNSNITGTIYSVIGWTIIAPGLSSVTVWSYNRPATLLGAADSATRSLLTYYPDIWLQAALVEGFRYLDDTEAELKAQQRLDTAVVAANARGDHFRNGPGLAMSDQSVNITARGPGL